MATAGTETTTSRKKKKAAKKTAPVKSTEVDTDDTASEASTAIITYDVRESAMQTDVGPRVINMLNSFQKEEEKLNQQYDKLQAKRYDVLGDLTMGLVQLAKLDDTIDLADVFSGDQKVINRLNDRCGVGLGWREIVTVKGKQTTVYADSVKKFFPIGKKAGGKEQKTSPEFRRKQTFQQNYMKQVKKAQRAAYEIIQAGIEAEKDDSGTLLLSGPVIEKHFGAESVLLNEKQTVQAGDTAIQLKAKPSFTEIGNMGSIRATGQSLTKRPDSRKEQAKQEPELDAETAVVAMCDNLIKATNRLHNGDGIGDKAREALERVQNVIEEVLK